LHLVSVLYGRFNIRRDWFYLYLEMRKQYGPNKARKTDPRGTNPEDVEARKWLAQHCGFPDDRKKAETWSIDVYNSYNMNPLEWKFKSPKVKTWGIPAICSNSVVNSECANQPQKMPSVFTSITPISENRNTSWWIYDFFKDGLRYPFAGKNNFDFLFK